MLASAAIGAAIFAPASAPAAQRSAQTCSEPDSDSDSDSEAAQRRVHVSVDLKRADASIGRAQRTAQWNTEVPLSIAVGDRAHRLKVTATRPGAPDEPIRVRFMFHLHGRAVVTKQLDARAGVPIVVTAGDELALSLVVTPRNGAGRPPTERIELPDGNDPLGGAD